MKDLADLALYIAQKSDRVLKEPMSYARMYSMCLCNSARIRKHSSLQVFVFKMLARWRREG
jgi:hypothetical protein